MLNSNPRSVLTFTIDLQGQIQGQMTENALETKLIGRIAFLDVKISANAVGKCHSTFGDLAPLTFKVKFQVKRRRAGKQT